MKYIKSPLKQEGNKYSYLGELYSFFPHHKIYIEPFCGTGVVAINNCQPKVKLLNDHNKMIYWMFMVLSTRRGQNELIKSIQNMPIYFSVLKGDYPGGGRLVDKIAKMILFAKLSLFGRGTTLKLSSSLFLSEKELTQFKKQYIDNCKWANKDFRIFLKSISFKRKDEELDAFVYCDPPYVLEKGGLAANKNFNEGDMEDLWNLLSSRSWKFAISCRSKSAEFWQEKGLYVERLAAVNVGFKSTLSGQESEYLAMNYRIQPELF